MLTASVISMTMIEIKKDRLRPIFFGDYFLTVIPGSMYFF
jgi:hypothetical protein